MRVLVLGGTVFLSYATASAAVARGHEVTCAARGESGTVPAGAELVRLDRAEPHADWSPLTGRSWDVVVDVARYPSWVRRALDALAERTDRWVFVSSVSVYADHSTPGADTSAEVLEPLPDDADETDMAWYGRAKVSCERLVRERCGDNALVLRPGLVVGPGDPSGRFAYWPHRMAEASMVLAPGEPQDPVQMVDVRDLADWLVRAAERGLHDVYDAVAPALTRGEMLEAVATATGSDPRVVWVPQEFLIDRGVRPWMGERSLPLWLPLPEYAGMMSRDVQRTVDAGLDVRPLVETARDTLAWLQYSPTAAVTGLTAPEHRELLRAWSHLDLKLT